MQGELNSTPRPVLDEATRSLVRRSLDAGLVELDDLKKVVVSLMAESEVFTPKRLADCPVVVADLIARMTAKRPENRPKSAVDLLAQLERLRGSGDHVPRGPMRKVIPAGDTAIDQQRYQATLDDSSLPSERSGAWVWSRWPSPFRRPHRKSSRLRTVTAVRSSLFTNDQNSWRRY